MSLRSSLPIIQIPSTVLTNFPFNNAQSGLAASTGLGSLQSGRYLCNYNYAFAVAGGNFSAGSVIYITTGNMYSQPGAIILGVVDAPTEAGVEEFRGNSSFSFSLASDALIYIYVVMTTSNAANWNATTPVGVPIDAQLNTIFFVKLA